MIKCKQCNVEYDMSSKLYLSYKKTLCRDCYNKNQRQIMHKRITKSVRDYFNHLMKDIIKRNKEVNIDSEYLEMLYKEQDGKCKITGIDLHMNMGRNYNSISVDRIDSNKGYIIGNVQIVCLGFNMLKQNWDEEIVHLIAKKTVDYYENKIK